MSNAIIIKHRREQKEKESLEQAAIVLHKKVWKKKTDMLAFRANVRYDEANMNAE